MSTQESSAAQAPRAGTDSNPAPQPAPAGMPPPISDVTAKLYERILRRLMRFSMMKHSRDITEPVWVSPTQIVNDLFDRRDDELTPGSFATYRSALIWCFSNRIHDPLCAQALELIRTRTQELEDQTPKTKQKKLHTTIPEHDYHLLIEELAGASTVRGGDRTTWAYRTQYFLQAGLAAGLRPIEWTTAAWKDDSKTILVAKTAKKKVGLPAFMRKNHQAAEIHLDEAGTRQSPEGAVPDEREIPILSNIDRFSIDQHLALLEASRQEGVPFERYHQECRRALWRACQKIWNGRKLYTLYSMRSQFSANRKALVGSEQTSLLMGHSRPDSPSAAHYGKANQAHSGFVRQKATSTGAAETQVPTQMPTMMVEPAAEAIGSAH